MINAGTDSGDRSLAGDSPFNFLGSGRSRRHTVVWDALTPKETAIVEHLLTRIKLEARRLLNLRAFGGLLDSRYRPEQAAKYLVDEAVAALNLERLCLQLDPYCVGPNDPRGIPGNGDVDPGGPEAGLRHRLQKLIAGWCATESSIAATKEASSDGWPALTPLQRAATVNSLVMDVLEVGSSAVVRTSPDDVVHAANGNAAAWERLRAIGARTDESDAPAPAVSEPNPSQIVIEDARRRFQNSLEKTKATFKKDPKYKSKSRVTAREFIKVSDYEKSQFYNLCRELRVDHEPYLILKEQASPV